MIKLGISIAMVVTIQRIRMFTIELTMIIKITLTTTTAITKVIILIITITTISDHNNYKSDTTDDDEIMGMKTLFYDSVDDH